MEFNRKDRRSSFLFFAQSLEELLFHHTLDSFKSPALNTHLNIFELQFLSAEIFRNKVKAGALKPVLEELENRIKTDPAIEDQKDLCSDYHAKIKASIKHPDELFFSAKSLLNLITTKAQVVEKKS